MRIFFCKFPGCNKFQKHFYVSFKRFRCYLSLIFVIAIIDIIDVEFPAALKTQEE